ncbi:MAG: SulP family sulfate permease [Cognaticolwellia sp.]|jgi:SulP family sulfate permease
MTSKYFKVKKRHIAITTWLPNYPKVFLKDDITAGLTVGIMLIPQGMAYAMIAGLPAIYGLYAAIIPCFIYAIFGSSRQLAVGPTAMISLLVATGIGGLAEVNTTEYLQLAITLALMVGFVQVSLGFFRLGFLVNYLSHPVISGFTSAAAVIIAFSQFKHLLGVDIENNKHIHYLIMNVFEQLPNTNFFALAIGISGIVLILLVKRIIPIIPGALMAVSVGILVTWGLGLDEYGVKIVGEVPSGLPSFILPNFDFNNIQSLIPTAITIGLLGFIESIAIAKAMESKHKDYILFPNQELAALGLMNIFGSFFQSYTTAGSFSRTAVNDENGAKTGLASIVTGLFIILTLLFLTGLFYYLPKPILASIIMLSVYGLIDTKEVKKLWYVDRKDFWVLIFTFSGTLFLGIEEGILLGVVISMVIVIYETTLPNYAILGKIPDETYYKDVTRFSNLKVRPHTLIMRFEARLYFANVNFFKKVINNEIKNKPELKAFFLDASSINTMDSSGFHAMEDVIDGCHRLGIDFYLIGIKGRVRDEMKRSGLMNKIREDRIFIEIHHAICEYNDYPYKDFSDYVTQSDEEFIEE